ncbi:Down syndrome cell adhesion molecule-like protein Dscam2 isoform X2 [Ischnura elegans]|uniref:Down syndrome cell adhesion molecule-like protein Dscam2 isoform X2 n=1 Tax=Ischnura elegans TaxID=197161 RepID=UPI001ED8A20A|nr:Down syndrome cell adhesion molecule-like protein Dscam2 isoform X2 [Ischnura elegans]
MVVVAGAGHGPPARRYLPRRRGRQLQGDGCSADSRASVIGSFGSDGHRGGKNWLGAKSCLGCLFLCCLCFPEGVSSISSASSVSGGFGVDESSWRGPQLTVEPPARLEFSNSSGGRLHCAASGNPPPTLHWVLASAAASAAPAPAPGTPGDYGYGSGGVIAPAAAVGDVAGVRRVLRNGTLLFPPFPPAAFRHDVHGAVYRCLASNAAGRVLSRDSHVRAVVTQGYSVEAEAVGSGGGGEAGVPRGCSARLRCTVPSHVREWVRVVAWVREPSSLYIYPSLHGDGKFHVLPSGDLLVFNVDFSDQFHSFRCRTIHRLTRQVVVSSAATIRVTDYRGVVPPVIVDHTPVVHVAPDEGAVLMCLAQGCPVPDIRWYRLPGREGGPPIPVGGSTGSMGSSGWGGGGRIRAGGLLLAVEAARPEDAGTFRCSAANAGGEAGAEARLVVDSPPPRPDLSPPSRTANLGEAAEFRCTLAGSSPSSGVVVSWLKDGRPLDGSATTSATTSAGGGGGGAELVSVLRVARVQREDRGMYQCVVRTDKGTVAQATAELRLGDAPPVLAYSFIEQTLQPGPAVSLKCSASGTPTPQLGWTLDGFPLPANGRFVIGQYVTVHGDVISHVNISNVMVEDGGEYTCTAQNRAGRSSHSARLNVYGLPYIRPIPKVTAVAGERLILKCPVAGYPIEDVRWERDNRELPVDLRQKVFPNGTLSVDHVQKKSDAGVYTCTARNKQGHSARRSGEVAVIVPPIIEPFSFQEGLSEGMRSRTVCGVSQGDPPLSITWLKDGVPLFGGGPSSPSSSASSSALPASSTLLPGVSAWPLDPYSSLLNISSLSSSHSGEYTCVASNRAAEVRFKARLQVKVPPRWIVEPEDVNVARNKHVVIQCQADGVPKPTIVWKKATGGKSGDYQEIRSYLPASSSSSSLSYPYIPSAMPTAPSVRILANGSLLVQHAREEQEGYYLCQANNGVGTGVGKVVHLTVNSAPYFPTQTQPITVRKGEVATLHCEVGGDQPISILWLKGLDVLNPSTNYRHSVKQETGPGAAGSTTSSSLLIDGIEGSDGGRYTCQASNAFGRDQQIIQLIVQEPPPSPTRPEAASVGSRYVDLKWKQGEPPIAPATSRDHISIEGTEVQKFILQYKEISEPWSSAVEIEIPVSGDTTDRQPNRHGWQPPQSPWSPVSTSGTAGQWYHKRIDSLRPATRYSFRVASEGAGGRGTYGEVLEVRTEPQRPSAPPRNAILHPLSSTSLRLSWNAPPIDAWHGDVHAYAVGIRDASSGSTHFNFSTYPVEEVEDDNDLDELNGERKVDVGRGVDLRPEDAWGTDVRQQHFDQHLGSGSSYHFSLVLTGLRPFSRYAAVVQAVNQVGAGPLSEPAEAQTIEDVPSMPPQDVRCAALTPQSLQVSWQPPPSSHAHGIIRGYKLTYEPADDVSMSDETWETKKTTALTTVLSGLRRFANYSLRVAAFTGVGDGVAALPIHCRTDEDVPGPPADIKVIVSSPQSLLVSWLPPREPNGVITKYNLYNRVNDGSGVIGRGIGDGSMGAAGGSGGQQGKRSLPGTHTSFEAKGLAPRVEHSFWVTATTRAGEGRSTRVASMIPTARVPARIYSFGGQVIKPWRNQVVLECLAVGSPPASSTSGQLPRTWFVDSVPIQSSMSYPLSGGVTDFSGDTIVGHGRIRVKEGSGALTIHDLQRNDAGNYTCRVENSEGTDAIYYSLVVQTPPGAPSVYVTSTTTSSVVVHWKTGDTGAAPLTGFTLNYRRNHGEWEEAQIPRHSTSYQLKGLSCGTSYHLFLTAHNRVGSSPASSPLVARTQGEVPGVPTYSPTQAASQPSMLKAFLTANSTAVRIRLRLWPDGGCPIMYFVIENRPINQHQWNLVSNDVKPSRHYTLSRLNPSTVYRLRITAHNMAGSSTSEFTFVTLTKDGVSPSPELVRLAGGFGLDGGGGGKQSLLTDVRVVAPLAVSTMALLGAGAAACLCWKNKSSASAEEHSQCLSSKGGAASSLSTSATMDNKQNAETQIREQQQQHSGCSAAEQAYYATIHKVALAAASSSATVDKIPETSEDISPYATFHLGDAASGNMGGGGSAGHAHMPPSVLPCSNTLLHSFIYHEQPLTEGCASPPHRTPASHRRREGKGASSSGAASVLTSGGSEGFHSPDSLDSDPDQLTSSRTESSNQLECGGGVDGSQGGQCRGGPVQGRNRIDCGGGPGGEHRRRRGGSGGGQSYIYHGAQSSTSSDISPMVEQKSLPRRGRPRWLAPPKALSPWGHHGGGQQQPQHHLPPPPPPPVPPSLCYPQQLNQRDNNSSGSVTHHCRVRGWN